MRIVFSYCLNLTTLKEYGASETVIFLFFISTLVVTGVTVALRVFPY